MNVEVLQFIFHFYSKDGQIAVLFSLKKAFNFLHLQRASIPLLIFHFLKTFLS